MRRLLLAALFLALFCVVLPSTAQDLTPTPTCPEKAMSRLSREVPGRVVGEKPLEFYRDSDLNSSKIGKIPSGELFGVDFGPRCEGDTVWWEITYHVPDGLQYAWLPDTGQGEPSFVSTSLEHVCELDVTTGETLETFGLDGEVYLRSQPRLDIHKASDISGYISNGAIFTIINGPQCDETGIWIEIQSGENTGWYLITSFPICSDRGCQDLTHYVRYPLLPLETVVPTGENNPLLPDESFQPGIALDAITAENVKQIDTLKILGTGFAVDFAWAPDESQLAVALSTEVNVYQPNNFEQPVCHLTGFQGIVRKILYQPDPAKRWLLVADSSGAVTFRDTTTCQSVGTLTHEKAVVDIALDSDGLVLAVATDGAGVYTWDIRDLTQPVNLYHFSDQIKDVEFTPDDATVIGTGERIINAYVLETGAMHPLAQLETGAGRQFDQAVISPDGSALAALVSETVGDTAPSYSSFVNIWGLRDDAPGLSDWTLTEFTNDRTRMGSDLAFAPDSQSVLAVTQHEQWDMHDVTVGRYEVEGALTGTFSPDGSLIAFGTTSGDIQLYAGNQSQGSLKGLNSAVLQMDFSPNGSYITARGYDNSFHIWKMQTHQQLASLQFQRFVSSFSVSPDETHILSTDDRMLWNVETGKAETVLNRVTTSCNDGLLLYVDDAGHRTPNQLANPDHPFCLQIGFKLASYLLTNPVFSPDGTRVAVTYFDYGTVIAVMDVQTGGVIQSFGRHFHNVWRIAFSPDGNKLLALETPDTDDNGESSYVITLRDTATTDLLLVLDQKQNSVHELIYSPDGTRIAWHIPADDYRRMDTLDVIHIYDLATGQDTTISVPLSLYGLLFTADGKLIISADDSGDIHFWNVETGDEVKILQGQIGFIRQMTLSADGARLYTSAEDGTLRVWGIPAP